MTKYYEVLVQQTSKAVGNSKQNYSTFNEQTHRFNAIKEIKEWLKNKYGNCKKEKIYRDGKNPNTTVHVGYIYCFKNSDYSHAPVESWYQQDWVTVYEIKSTPIIIK